MAKNKQDKKVKTGSETRKIQTPQSSRRGFLKKAWWGLGALAGVELIWAVSSFLSPKRKPGSSNLSSMKTVGNISGFANGSVTPFRSGQFYLVRLDDGGLIALSLKCTHLACSVSWDGENQKFVCPCHASQFDIAGNVINPPAPRALDYYPVIVEQGVVKVNTSKPIKRKEFEKSQAVYV